MKKFIAFLITVAIVIAVAVPLIYFVPRFVNRLEDAANTTGNSDDTSEAPSDSSSESEPGSESESESDRVPDSSSSESESSSESGAASESESESVIDKTTPPAPEAPTAKLVSSTGIRLNKINGCEYSIDGSVWQDSTTFSGLTANTTYTLYARYKETAETYASPASSAQFTTDKTTPAAPEAPTAQTVTSSAIRLNKVNGCEYSIDGSTWQDSNVFSGLSAGTTYTFYIRYAETSTSYASKTASAKITTDKTTTVAPAAPTAHSITATSITLNAISGCEYSIDGNTWQSSPTFSGLNWSTPYTLYIRYAETSTTYASPASSARFTTLNGMTTPAAPPVPTAHTITDTKIALNGVAGCEYSIDGINWSTKSTFYDLKPETTYTFYIRYAATSTTYASPASSAQFTTIKSANEAHEDYVESYEGTIANPITGEELTLSDLVEMSDNPEAQTLGTIDPVLGVVIEVSKIEESVTASGRREITVYFNNDSGFTIIECEYCHELPCPGDGDENCPHYDPLKDPLVTCQQCGRPRGDGYNGTCTRTIDWSTGIETCHHYTHCVNCGRPYGDGYNGTCHTTRDRTTGKYICEYYS